MAERCDKVDFTVGNELDIQEGLGLAREIKALLDPTIPGRVDSLEGTRTWVGKVAIGLFVIVVGGLTLWALQGYLAGAAVAVALLP